MIRALTGIRVAIAALLSPLNAASSSIPSLLSDRCWNKYQRRRPSSSVPEPPHDGHVLPVSSSNLKTRLQWLQLNQSVMVPAHTIRSIQFAIAYCRPDNSDDRAFFVRSADFTNR
jgi:hypothetical protein